MNEQTDGDCIKSLCTGICLMDVETGFCQGCLRTIDEIVNWAESDEKTKSDILEKITRRKYKTSDQYENS